MSSQRIRTGVAALAAVGVPLLAASLAVGTAANAGAATAQDLGTSSVAAPVKLPGQKAARSYSAADAAKLERTGGDPAVLAYWTPARMAAAKGLDAPGDAQRVDQAAKAVAVKAPATSVRPVAPKLLPANVKAVDPVTNFSITNGKLFFNGYESGSWCSASAVNTASKRVLITAGHCVHGGAGSTWKSNVVFVPRYNAFNADRDPVGRFQAYRLRTFNSWISGSDLNRDVGYVTTFSGGDFGARVVDTVGGHGIAYNGGTQFETSIFGYPSNRDGGNKMWACWGTAVDNSASDNRSKIGCNFGGGSSGGPWTWNYSNATGLGYVRSVMSTIDGAGVNRGPYFDTAVLDGLNAANGDW